MLAETDTLTFRKIVSGKQEIADELHRITKANKGNLSPEAVVRNAEKQTSPLHKYFTWDDSEAARKCRLIEAQMLIRTVKVRVETHAQDKPVEVRAFVNVQLSPPDEAGEDDREQEPVRAYVPVEAVLKHDDYRKQMLEQASRDLAAFRRKYAILKELSSVFDEVDKFQSKFNFPG